MSLGIRLILDQKSKAYYYEDVAAAVVINDKLDQFPVVVWAANNNFHAYVRPAGDQVLTFHVEGDRLVDEETGSSWDVVNGLATDGLLPDQNLQPVPSFSVYD